MPSRLFAAFKPTNPLYRRESGAGRRVVMTAKLVGLVFTLGAYSLWMILALAGKDHGELPVGIVAVGSCLFCIVFFAMGVQSVRGEVADGTAEALIMTPISRRKLILSKLGGSVEFLVIAALLFPFYCFTLAPARHDDRLMAFLHGALLRIALASEGWGASGELSFPLESLIGLGAFLSDLAWYAFFASCGIWAATTSRTAARAWFKGLAISGGLLFCMTIIEWIGGDNFTLYWALRSIGTGQIHSLAYAFDFGWRDQRPLDWMIAWLLIAMSVRILLAWFFVWRAARRFDRIAGD